VPSLLLGGVAIAAAAADLSLSSLCSTGIDRESFPYVAPFQPWLSYFGFVFLSLVILFNGYTVFLSGNWNTDDFIVGYISLPIFIVFWLGWKVILFSFLFLSSSPFRFACDLS
jgi:amino acid permease